MKSRLLLLAVCLLVAAPASARESIIFGPVLEDEAPSMFVKCELLGLGFSYPFGGALQVARVTFTAWNFRIGTTLGEAYTTLIEDGGQATWPVHVGYTLFSRPHRVLFFHNMFPEVYAEASAAFWKTSMVPFVRGSLYAGVEGFGFGIGLETGVMSLGWDASDMHVQGTPERRTDFYAAFRLKFLAVSFGF
jgi:hypothetical protein